MKKWIGWRAVLTFAIVTSLLLLLGVDELPDQDRLTLTNLLILAIFGAVWMALYRVLHGERQWQRRVQSWARQPMTHWNDWRATGLLGAIAFGLYALGSVDLPPGDKWSSASVLLLLALCLAVQMINVAFFRKRGRK